MGAAKAVRDIMVPIEEYDKVSGDAHLCDALSILKKNHERKKANPADKSHETLFVTDASGKIIGKLSPYDLIRGLVPEHVKKPEISRAYYSLLSSRALEVTEEVGEVQERFQWLRGSFADLVKQEAHKKVSEIMSPVHPVLKEDDGLNHAVYVMFREDIRQPLVAKGKDIVGVVDLRHIFTDLLDIIGPECHVIWE